VERVVLPKALDAVVSGGRRRKSKIKNQRAKIKDVEPLCGDYFKLVDKMVSEQKAVPMGMLRRRANSNGKQRCCPD
jgi:hypothetical protein